MSVRKLCAVCKEPGYKVSLLCENCRFAKTIIQRSVNLMMDLHGVPPASGKCVDCGVHEASCRDHRLYARPLDVEHVCRGCNSARGHARDLYELIRKHRGVKEAPAVLPDAVPHDLKAHMNEYERRIIERAIVECRHNLTATARRLGITFRALRYRLENLNIEK